MRATTEEGQGSEVFSHNEHFVHSFVTPLDQEATQENLRTFSELSQDFLVGSR